MATSANIRPCSWLSTLSPSTSSSCTATAPSWLAVRLLPYVVILPAPSTSAPGTCSKVKYYMPIYVISGVLLTLGSALLMVYLDPATSESTIYGLTVLVAIGTGLTIQIGLRASRPSTRREEDMGDAISFAERVADRRQRDCTGHCRTGLP